MEKNQVMKKGKKVTKLWAEKISDKAAKIQHGGKSAAGALVCGVLSLLCTALDFQFLSAYAHAHP